MKLFFLLLITGFFGFIFLYRFYQIMKIERERMKEKFVTHEMKRTQELTEAYADIEEIIRG